MSMQGKNRKAPDIPIDEALRMFLALAYPNGIPGDVDKEELFAALREKIAKDRPEWAEASAPPSEDEGPSAEQGYSALKAAIARKAGREEIPEDPEERYLYLRRQEARLNREEREEAKRLDRIQEDMRRRLLEQKKEVEEDTLRRAAVIRKAMEERLRGVMTPQYSSSGDDGDLSLQKEGRLDTGFSPSPRERFQAMRDLTDDERIEAMREFNRSRRELLQPRESYLSPRRPSERLSVDDAPERPEKERPEREKMEGTEQRDLTIDMSLSLDAAGDEGLSLEGRKTKRGGAWELSL